MTQTGNAPSAEQISAWLAAQPCPECEGRGTHIKSFPAGRDDVDCPTHGLAFEWASVPCVCGGDTCLCHACAITEAMGDGSGAHIPEACRCSGSGRVPKDVGLWIFDEWVKLAGAHGPTLSWEHDHWVADLDTWTEIRGEGDTPELAALRAIAAQAGMPQGKDARWPRAGTVSSTTGS